MNAQSPGNAYRVASLLLFPLWLFHAFFHGRNYRQADYLKRRLRGSASRTEKSCIWIHASSVGEVSALTPLVEALIGEGEQIFFTSFTASGLQTIQKNFAGQVESTVIPIDFLPCCSSFIHRHRFKLCLLMETELWPELLYQAARNRIAVVQINARLSQKTTDAPIFVRYLLRRALANVQYHLARNDIDKQRLIGLGADEDKIKVVGNLKSGISTTQTYDNLINRDYLLLASTHEGEEALFLDQRKPLRTLLVIAPRHPGRSEAIQQYLSAQNINYAVRSMDEAITPDTEVYLADTLGELKALIAHARIVIMGGSFDQTGGHNLIEPASLGRLTITGPSDTNIVDDIRLLGEAVLQVADVGECWERIDYFLNHPAAAEALGKKARETILSQNKITNVYLQEIKPFL